MGWRATVRPSLWAFSGTSGVKALEETVGGETSTSSLMEVLPREPTTR